MDTRLARRLKQLRAARGWSQERLAAKAGISRAYIGRLEIGRQDPSLSIVRRLARAFKVRIGELVE